MKLNNIVNISVKNNNVYKFIKLLSSFKIDYILLNKYEDYFTLDLEYSEFLKVKKLLKQEDYKVNKIKGIYGIKEFIKNKYIFILSYIFSFIVLFCLTNTIFYININTEDENVKKILTKELSNYNISKYHFMKSYKELETIKENILLSNKDLIDWLSIERHGITYNINLTKRVINNIEKNSTISDIVSSKDALIKHIEYSKGVVLKEINEYVKKGEVIITGNIIKSDKYLKGQVRSIGNVYGEVWYTVEVTVPYNYTEYINKNYSYNHYLIKLFGKEITLINKYNLDNIMYEESVVIDKPYLPFKVYKRNTSLYEYKTVNLTKEEAYDKALDLATSKVSLRLKDGEYIIGKKVLKKHYKSSKIVLEVFFKVYERISLEKEIEKIEVGTDISKKGD